MALNSIKGLLPTTVKDWVKSSPRIANFADRILNGRREVAVYIDVPTLVSPAGREYLFQVARSNNPENVIVEIGCYAGGSTYFLGRGAEISGSSVYSIDPFALNLERQIAEDDGSIYLKNIQTKPSKQQVERNIRRRGLENVVTLIEGFSPEVASTWSLPIGVLFVDGNHKQVYEDYQAWSKYLAKNAIIIFDDSNFPQHGRADVQEAIEKILRDNSRLIILRRIDGLISMRHY